MNRLAVVLFWIALLAASTAEATQQEVQAMVNWKLMDKCVRQAQAAFPDFTAESNAKRDASLKTCLSSENLPPRPDLAAPASR